MLKRNINILTNLFFVGYDINEAIRDMIRMQIEKAYPVYFFKRSAHRAKEQREARFFINIQPVVADILADNVKLGNSLSLKALRFFNERFHGAALQLPLNLGNHAKSTGMITAFRYFKIRNVARYKVIALIGFIAKAACADKGIHFLKLREKRFFIAL